MNPNFAAETLAIFYVGTVFVLVGSALVHAFLPGKSSGITGKGRQKADYAQLQCSPDEWWIMLGVGREATLGQVEAAYKELASKHHPDLGGDPRQMVRLNQAREAAHGELRE